MPVINNRQVDEIFPDGGYRIGETFYDSQNRRYCKAKSVRTGQRCRAFAMRGQEVCATHGGSAPQSKRAAQLRLMALVEPAIATLAQEMVKAEKSSDKQRAANSILDRAGIARKTHIESEDAKAMLYVQLQALRKSRDLEGDLDETD